MKKYLSIIVTVIIFVNCIGGISISSANSVSEEELKELFIENIEEQTTVSQTETEVDETVDKAAPCGVTIDDEFSEDIVFVVISKEQSRLNKEYTPADFPQLDIYSIEIKSEYNEDKDNRQILKIVLNNSTKQKVIDSIRILEELEFVYSAEPNMILRIISPTDEELLMENISTSAQIMSDITIEDKLLHESNANYYSGACCSKNYTDPTKNNPVIIGIVGNGIDPNSDAGAKVVEHIRCDTKAVDTDLSFDAHTTNVANVIVREHIPDRYDPHVVCGNDKYAGICNNVSLCSLDVRPCFYPGDYSTMEFYLNAIDYAKDNGIRILSFSDLYYGLTGISNTWEQEVASYGGIIVVSASNSGDGNFHVNYDDIDCAENAEYFAFPTSCTSENVIVVGNSRWSYGDYIINGSRYGKDTVDLFAIGDIFSTYNGYNDTMTGASFATPRVAGAAAVLLSINELLTPAQIKHYIMTGVDSSSNLAGKCVSGGSLNIYKSAKMVIADMAYDGKSIFTGHFTRTDKIQVAAITRGAYNAAKIYVWTYNKKPGTFSDPEHLKTNFSYALDNDWGRNKFRIVCGDFDGNGYDEFCTLYDYDDYLFIEGKDYICHPGDIPVPVEGFTGKVAALDYDNDGYDEVVGFYGISEGVTDLYVWDFNGSGASMTASLTYQYRIPIYFNAQNIDYKVVSGNFDSDAREEVAAIYRSSVSIYHYYLIMINFTENGIAYTEPLSVENTFDVNTFWGRIVTCNYDGAGPDEIVFLYNNPNASPNGIINYGVILNTVSGAWSVEPLYESGAYEFNADISTDLMSAGDYNGDGYDEVLAFYKLPAATPANVRTRIYFSQHEIRNGEHKLTGYFCKWDPRGQY